jgi:ferredoxin-type protein NapH
MNNTTKRVLVSLAFMVVIALGFIFHQGIGNLSSLGWDSISLLCPLGALTTMLAAKTVVPQALISLCIALVLMFIFGRLFCGWVCPVPVINKIPRLFKKKSKGGERKPVGTTQKESIFLATDVADEIVEGYECALEANYQKRQAKKSSPVEEQASAGAGAGAGAQADAMVAALTPSEQAALQVGSSCSSLEGKESACSACGACDAFKRKTFDSRHLVLVGALLSATIFGFPVFCMICPIGLTFGTIFLVVSLFATGDITWSLIAVPVVLVLEVLVFRKWCGTLCPLSAFMSLVTKPNKKILQPNVNVDACVEKGDRVCGKCAAVCEVGINPRHPELGMSFNECLKCRACVEDCPGEAISFKASRK